MNDIWIIAIVVVLVLASGFAYPYAKRKGWITGDNVTGAKNALDIARLIMLVINIDNVTKNRTKFILDMACAAVSYIEGLSNVNADKMSLSMETINEVLNKLKITPTADEQALISRIVAEVLNL